MVCHIPPRGHNASVRRPFNFLTFGRKQRIMSNRERWTVYPLLFLTLGIALRDKITESIITRSIECQDLVVLGQDGKPRVRLAGSVATVVHQPNAAGRLTPQHQNDAAGVMVYSASGQPSVVILAAKNGGSVETISAAGLPHVVLSSSDRGGVVTAFENERNVVVQMGHESQGSGVFAINHRENLKFAAPMIPQTAPHFFPPPNPGNVRPGQPADPAGGQPKPPATPEKRNQEEATVQPDKK